MDACRLGAYRRAHRSNDEHRHMRAELAVRDALVRTRTRYIALIKALLRRDGLRLNSTASHVFEQRIGALAPSPSRTRELQPLLDLLVPLSAQIDAADEWLTALQRTNPIVALLTTAPGIGPVTASALVATIGDITRFNTAHQFEAYLGIVPGELMFEAFDLSRQ